jgi:hypothetical protein
MSLKRTLPSEMKYNKMQKAEKKKKLDEKVADLQYNISSEEEDEEYDSSDEDFDEEADNELLRESLKRAQERVRKSGVASPEHLYNELLSGKTKTITFPTLFGTCSVTIDENNFASRQGWKTITTPNVLHICSSIGGQCREASVLGKKNTKLCSLYNTQDDAEVGGEMRDLLMQSPVIIQGFLDSGLKIKLTFGKILCRTETYKLVKASGKEDVIEAEVFDTWEYDMTFERDRKVLLIHMLDEVANTLLDVAVKQA